MKKMLMAGLALAVLALGACDKRRGMVARTYTLHRLTYQEAESLLTPYVGEGGYISGKDRFITVRERPERLDSITAILLRYDGGPHAVTLRFQVIEAGDFAGGDSTIARVEAPLRELFRYRGYRLLGEMTMQATEMGGFEGSQPGLHVEGVIHRVISTGPDARINLAVKVESQGSSISTSVGAVPGKTIIIGSQKKTGGGAIIAAVTPELVRP